MSAGTHRRLSLWAGGNLSLRAREAWAGWLFVLPALLGLLLFMAVPFALAIGLSFTNLRLGSPLPTRFVGLENYTRLWEDEAFRRALLNNAMFATVVVPVQTALALGLAVLLNQKLRARAWFRAVFFMPVVFPMALIAVVWQLMYAEGASGLINGALAVLSSGAFEPRAWLRDPWLALPAIMVLSVWQGVGFQMVVLLAGLQAVPRTLYEAAHLDGASAWQRFRFVTLPQLRNALVFTALITTILAFRVFDQVHIMTRGGPNRATTTVMFEAVQAAYGRQQVGYAAAMTVVFFVCVLTIALVQRRLVREERETGA